MDKTLRLLASHVAKTGATFQSGMKTPSVPPSTRVFIGHNSRALINTAPNVTHNLNKELAATYALFKPVDRDNGTIIHLV